MAYEKQNFKDGQVLTAEHLNKMEDELARKKSWSELGDTKQEIMPLGDAQFTFNEDMGTYCAMIETTVSMQPGDVFEVVWDGTTYTSVSLDADGQGNVAFGNLSAMGAADTGEPYIAMTEGNTIAIMDIAATEDVTRSIAISLVKKVKIGHEYLPFSNKIYYVGELADGGYVYSDPGCTVKVTALEAYTDLTKGLVTLFIPGPAVQLVPVFVGTRGEARDFCCVIGNNLAHYYTAEYVPE